MSARRAALLALALLGGCNAPDYTPVRDWARSAGVVAGFPPLEGGAGLLAAADTPAETRDGIAAMQEALVTWLAALARMADDGVLPYMESPFAEVAPRAAKADADGGAAVAALGALLRRFTRENWQAPEMRDAIGLADPLVQRLVLAIRRALDRPLPPRPPGQAPLAEGQQAARERYLALLGDVALGHALLAARAADITKEEVVRQVQRAEDDLRRAALALPRPIVRLPAAAAR
jgi:hypothetical protein